MDRPPHHAASERRLEDLPRRGAQSTNTPLRRGLLAVLAAAALLATAWVTDTIRAPGERAFYSVDCSPGTWEGARCYGRLVAGRQYRFKAIPASHEVLFWTVGSPANAGKYVDCSMKDADNWSCPPASQTAEFVTYQVVAGDPVSGSGHSARSFHRIQKWRWLLLDIGVPVGHDAL